MGRHKKMESQPPKRVPERRDPIDHAHDEASLNDHGITYARNKPVIEDRERYERLLTFSIKKPNAKLAREAIKQAAVIWSLVPKKSDKRDADAIKFVARFLYDEALYWGTIDPRRAFQVATVNEWLRDQPLRSTTARTYASNLYDAGRVLYPAQFRRGLDHSHPRPEPTDPASQALVDELYGIAATLNGPHKIRTQLILDLTTQAGLRSSEMLDLRGSDVTTTVLETGETIAMIRVHRQGKVDRIVPIICPIRTHRLLERAAEVGRGHFLPTRSGERPGAGAVGNSFQYLRERGFPTTTAEALRVRWLVDLANSALPAAVLVRLAGKSLFRSLEKHADDLTVFDPVRIAELQLQARRTS